MASGLDLRKYQEDILAKLESLSEQQANASNSRLGVGVGQYNVLVDLAEISEVLPLPDMHPVPLTQPWFLGMANVRGNLYGISDLAQIVGQSSPVRTSNSRVLLVNQELIAQAGVMIERLIGLRNLDDMKPAQQTIEQPFCFKPQQYEDAEGNLWLELDCHALVNAKEFVQPSI